MKLTERADKMYQIGFGRIIQELKTKNWNQMVLDGILEVGVNRKGNDEVRFTTSKSLYIEKLSDSSYKCVFEAETVSFLSEDGFPFVFEKKTSSHFDEIEEFFNICVEKYEEGYFKIMSESNSDEFSKSKSEMSQIYIDYWEQIENGEHKNYKEIVLKPEIIESIQKKLMEKLEIKGSEVPQKEADDILKEQQDQKADEIITKILSEESETEKTPKYNKKK